MNRRQFLSLLINYAALLPLLELASCGRSTTASSLTTSVTRESEISANISANIDSVTGPIYDSQYQPIKQSKATTTNAEIIGTRLQGKSLESMLSDGTIAQDGTMPNLTIPIGVWDPISKCRRKKNFAAAMERMWDVKLNVFDSYYPEDAEAERVVFEAQKNRFVRAVKNPSKEIYNISKFKDMIGDACKTTLKEINSVGQKYWNLQNSQVAELLDEVVRHLSPEVFLGIAIQELLPVYYQEKKINSAFKAHYMDRLLIEAGPEFIEGFPAMYDPFMSFGPFQLTNNAILSVRVKEDYNRYVSDRNKVRGTKVQDLFGLRDHVNVTIMYAYHNWERLANSLTPEQRALMIDKLRADSRKSEILVAGITGTMHHIPGDAIFTLKRYLDIYGTNNIHWRIKEKVFGTKLLDAHKLDPKTRKEWQADFDQLAKYYDSVVRAYLYLKESFPSISD